MKEKLTAGITLGFIFTLFFYYKVINPSTDDNIVSTTTQSNILVESINKESIQKNHLMILDPVSSYELSGSIVCWLVKAATS